jgi:septum formation inhibitor-activating ATPase MinD
MFEQSLKKPSDDAIKKPCASHSNESYLFSSESVTEGHPDKVADQISDSIPYLGSILIDPKKVCNDANNGLPFIVENKNSPAANDFADIVKKIDKFLESEKLTPRTFRLKD